jgi:Carboxypeptidase regulatory-like domain
MTPQHQPDLLVVAQLAAPYLGRISGVRAISVSALALLACALVAPSVFGDCKCHHPQKGDATRQGANVSVVQQEENPYRELSGRVELHEDTPIEDVLVEVFDQPEYLLREGPSEAPKQKKLAACVTAEDGKFCFRHLPPGKYELRASINGGWNITHVYVVVDKKAGQTKRLRVGMSLGT